MEFVLGTVFGAVAMAIAVAVSITREAENRIVNYTIVLTEEETAAETYSVGKHEKR